jgi:hypothetical protein
MRRSVKIPTAFMSVAFLSGLTACDPGYTFTVHNPCNAPMTVDYGDSDEFGERGIGDAVTMEPHSTTEWTELDAHIVPPFGLLLLNGPRAGDLVKSETPDITIPKSACPR